MYISVIKYGILDIVSLFLGFLHCRFDLSFGRSVGSVLGYGCAFIGKLGRLGRKLGFNPDKVVIE